MRAARPRVVAAAIAATVLAIFGGPATAEPCGIAMTPGAGPVPLADLPAGIVTGMAECDGVTRPAGVWTLPVDPELPDLGIRDRPLFRSRPANPLVPVASAEVGAVGRITLFKRREAEARGEATAGEPDRRRPYRLFGTFCDLAAGDPLDCSAGAARVKMRADIVDADRDGVLDRARHQVSIWDGGHRLQVLMFETEHAGRPLGNAVPWIEALALAGRL